MASKEERRERLRRNLAKLSRQQISERNRKGWETRRRNTIFSGGDKGNAIGEAYDFAFDAVDKLVTPEQWDRIVSRLQSKDAKLSLRVADFNSERLTRAPQSNIRLTLKKGWSQKEAKAAIYAKLREYAKTSGTREKARDARRMREPGEDFEDDIGDDIADVDSDVYEGSPNTVTLLSSISFVSR